jgi:hypothetical protein
MSYLTVEVEIDHGHVAAKGAEPLPDKASGLLTIFPATKNSDPVSPLAALESLQKLLRLDYAGATTWMNAVRDARR